MLNDGHLLLVLSMLGCCFFLYRASLAHAAFPFDLFDGIPPQLLTGRASTNTCIGANGNLGLLRRKRME